MNPLKIIIFQVHGNEYAIDVNQVYSIEKVQTITRVPGVAAFIKGVVNLRGVVIPIIDLKERFGFGTSEYHDDTRLLIVSWNDLQLGLIVDTANDVMDIKADNMKPMPETIDKVNKGFLQGVIELENRLITVLNLEKVLNEIDEEELSHIQ